MKFEDMMRQTKNQFVIGDAKSDEILENVLRYNELNSNKGNTYMDTCKHIEKERRVNMVIKEIQPDKRKRWSRRLLSGFAAIAAITLTVTGIIYITAKKDNSTSNIPSSPVSIDNETKQTENLRDITQLTQSDNEFYDMTKLEQNKVYYKFLSISKDFTIKEFSDVFGENQAEADKEQHYFCYMTDENNISYNLNANIVNNCRQKYLKIQFNNEFPNISSQYTDEDESDKQKISIGMTFDEVNEIFNDYCLYGIDIKSFYDPEGEYKQDISVQYIYFLERADGYSVMVAYYDMEDRTVTHYYMANK